jgi:hypothetical protein
LLLKPGHYDILYTSSDIQTDRYDFETGHFGGIQYAKPPKIEVFNVTKELVLERFEGI